MIEYIEVTKLHGHLYNPRKDLGDLTELAESIKENGILQNLTVVPRIMGSKTPEGPWQDGYTVVIGHRRLAAAKLAGLATVPCIISDMSPKEQIATMLLENMQRSDLTVYEQAQGFQQLMLFGDTVSDIAGKTGFSETTVRRRVKLLELDQEKFKKSVERGATLMDFAELEKIKNQELKNKVLDSIGTRNFDYELKNALDQQQMNDNMPIWVEALEKFAKQIKTTSLAYSQGMSSVAWYSLRNSVDTLVVPEDAGTAEYFFTITNYGQITIMKKYNSQSSNDDREAQERHRAIKERCDALNDIAKRAFELRKDFIKEYKGKKSFSAILDFWIRVKLNNNMYKVFNWDLFAELMDITLDEDQEFEDLRFENIADQVKASPEKVFLVTAYCDSGDSDNQCYHRWIWNNWPIYKGNPSLDELYKALEDIGYLISDEERALMDGTHELFSMDSK